MEIDVEGIVIIVGNYGSGKTEVSINLAVHRKRMGVDVRIADLDLVNLYFRTREARRPLSEMGIDVVVPPRKLLQADLPILSPMVSGMIRKPSQLTLLDAGGDDAGATVLASLADSMEGRNIRMLQVVNPFRPFTETVEGCMKIKSEIERASKLTIDGIIGNSNLIDETTCDIIHKGYDFLMDVSSATGLKLEFITASSNLIPQLEIERFSCPVLTLDRKLQFPWKRS